MIFGPKLLKDLRNVKTNLDESSQKSFREPIIKLSRKKETEHRHATVMSAEISGYNELMKDMNTEDASSVIKNCLKMFNAITDKYGGTVHKVIGNNLILLFGVPRAIEDAPSESINH